jgi:Tripartite tricarboxylate transporter family receptor
MAWIGASCYVGKDIQGRSDNQGECNESRCGGCLRCCLGRPGPGGANDLIARVAAEAAGKNLGQPVIIDNRPGAGAVVGTGAVARFPPMATPFWSARPVSLPMACC